MEPQVRDLGRVVPGPFCRPGSAPSPSVQSPRGRRDRQRAGSTAQRARCRPDGEAPRQGQPLVRIRGASLRGSCRGRRKPGRRAPSPRSKPEHAAVVEAEEITGHPSHLPPVGIPGSTTSEEPYPAQDEVCWGAEAVVGAGAGAGPVAGLLLDCMPSCASPEPALPTPAIRSRSLWAFCWSAAAW